MNIRKTWLTISSTSLILMIIFFLTAWPTSITIFYAIPLIIFTFIHYIILGKQLDTKVPFEPVRLAHLKLKNKTDIVAIKWEKHLNGVALYFITFIFLGVFLFATTGWFFNPIITFLAYATFLSLLLTTFSEGILDKNRKESLKPVLLAGAIAFTGVATYLLILTTLANLNQ